MLIYILFKGYTVNILHYDILKLFAEINIVYLNNIGMREKRNSLALIFKSSFKFLICGIFILKYFNGNNSVINIIVRLINYGHTANADNLLNLISTV